MSIPTWLYIFFGLCFVVIILVDLLCRFLNFRSYRDQKVVILELTPPHTAQKTPDATEQFFSVVHTVASHLSLKEQLLGRVNVMSLEVVSSRKQGIRYLIRVNEKEATILQHQITSYLPDVKFKITDDYIDAALERGNYSRVLEFTQARHFAYPFATHDSLAEHDPIAYVTGSMTKLQPNELIALQVIVSPSYLGEVRHIRNQLIRGQSPRLARLRWPLPFRMIGWTIRAFFGIFGAILSGIGEMLAPSYKSPSAPRKIETQAPIITPAAQSVLDSLTTKLAQPLYQANIRVLIVTEDAHRSTQTARGMRGALGAFSVPGYQELVSRREFPKTIKQRLRLYFFRHRLPSIFTSRGMQVAISEIAALYHFPYSGTTNTENVVSSMSKTLPASIALKNETPLAVTIGENQHHGSSTPIGLTEAERERHMYIVGGTGNGKTTMLQYAIVQDIQNGHGVAVLDPHGDMAETLLRYIPEERMKDVIYLNPDDLSYPIGINLLELDETLTGDELLREKDLITESAISVLRKIFSEDDSGGHRIEYVLRNTIQTALTVKGATLFTIFRLLNDTKYRKSIVRELDDGDLKNFWINEIGKAGDFQRVKMAAGITAKIGRFLFSASAKRILEQEKSSIDFTDILDSKKILICNFSKGLLGEDTSALFGTTVLAKIQLAALKRARQSQATRNPYYLYVDEFQNFATMSFVQMLSEARKYKLFLTMAEQSTSQQDSQRLVDIMLANVGTVVAFRSGSPADERLILPLFSPFVDEGEIANLPAYSFYVRIAAVETQPPMSGVTVLLDNIGDEATRSRVVKISRETYGKKRDVVVDDKNAQQKKPKRYIKTKAVIKARKSPESVA